MSHTVLEPVDQPHTLDFGDLSLEAYLLDMHKMDGVTHSMTHTVPHR